MDNQTILSEFGGYNQMQDMLDLFYYKVLGDKNLRDYFLDADMSRIRLNQKNFFASLLGGQEQYSGKDIKEAHLKLGISNEHFDAYKSHFQSVMTDMGKSVEIQQKFLEKVEAYRDRVVQPKQE